MLHRQRDAEGGAGAGFAPHVNPATVLPDYAVGKRQAEPGALANGFGGEEGLEDALQVLRRDAAAGVGDLDPDAVVRRACEH